MNWRDENATEKQIATIAKMSGILSWKVEVPQKRGDACDLIKDMMAEANKRVAVTGTMRVDKRFETIDDDDCLDDDTFSESTSLFEFED